MGAEPTVTTLEPPVAGAAVARGGGSDGPGKAGVGGPDPAFARYAAERVGHWDALAPRYNEWTGWSRGYHRRIRKVYRFLVPPGRRVLEVGCGHGELLAALEPSVGVGVDFSGAMLAEARRRHPGLTFVQADAHELALEGPPFDAVILSDLVNELWDVQRVLERVRGLCSPRTRVIVNAYSGLWEYPLRAARRAGLAKPLLKQNWLSPDDLVNLLGLAGFEPVRKFEEVLWPLGTPVVAPLCNRVLVKLWPFKHLALTNFIVARPKPQEKRATDGPDGPRWERSEGSDLGSSGPSVASSSSFAGHGGPSVSVVIPARNEAGNVRAILERVPAMGARTELIFVEGHSSDGTFETLERELAGFDRLPWALLKQTGKGKADAVRAGFEVASGDLLMILDADLTVPPEDLPRFYRALAQGTGEFVNGVRLVYPMEREAMRFLNLLGNKAFGLAFSWLLGQRIKDTLCGTKALWREDYRRIAAARAYFGDFDPFGDFDLIFGAARQSLKIVDLPIRYRQRTYGETNISRFRHGLLLARMVGFAARRLKFI